jgi:hypothetical protein
MVADAWTRHRASRGRTNDEVENTNASRICGRLCFRSRRSFVTPAEGRRWRIHASARGFSRSPFLLFVWTAKTA